MPRLLFAALLTALAAIAAHSTTAFGCDHCGQICPCQKTCRLVCETKKVEITCWGCKCEDFCIPGPGKPGCKHCEMVCEFCDEQCDPKGIHSQPKKFVWTDWCPGCAKIHTRKKLMKKTITKTVPSYKWVVEELCPNCCANAQSASVPAGTELPQPPVLPPTATVLPVQYIEADATLTDEPALQPAAFNIPLPQAPVKYPAPVAPSASKSWRNSLQLPWQR